MKKIILLFALTICSLQHLHSQSRLSIGLGIGQQFGLPGIRTSYNYNNLEGSFNFGYNALYRTICFGTGASYRFLKKEGYNSEAFITYNLGLFLFSQNDGSNPNFSTRYLHSLTISTEFDVYKSVRLRAGGGAMYLPTEWQAPFKILPMISCGYLIDLTLS